MRKPEHARRYHNTREAVWDAIRRLTTFTVAELCGEVAYDENTIRLYVKSLVRAGYLTQEEAGVGIKGYGLNGKKGVAQTKYVYTMVRDALSPPRVRKDGTEVAQGSGRRQMWQTMRMRKRFTLADLVALSSTEEHPVAESEADYYLRHLIKAGYVKPSCAKATEGRQEDGERRDGRERSTAKDREKGPGARHDTFRLVINSGPQAPMIQRIKQVYDPNTKTVVWTAKESAGERQ